MRQVNDFCVETLFLFPVSQEQHFSNRQKWQLALLEKQPALLIEPFVVWC